MPFRRFFSLIHIPYNSKNAPKEYGIWIILVGIPIMVLLLLAGWHIAAQYLVPRLYDGALFGREKENSQLRDQLRSLHQLDATLETQIRTLSERAADIGTILPGSGALAPVRGSNGATSPTPLVKVPESPSAAIRNIDRQLEKLLDETLAELDSLKSLETKSRENKSFWHGIPVILPVRGPVSRSFGSSRNLLSDQQRVHGGLDIAALKDEPVRATADGVVSRTGVNVSLGRYVEIVHQNGYRTRYGHLSKVLAERRKRVARGEVIGLVGKTGKTNGYDIHYEIYHEGRILDPSTSFFPEQGL